MKPTKFDPVKYAAGKATRQELKKPLPDNPSTKVLRERVSQLEIVVGI